LSTPYSRISAVNKLI